MSVSSSVPREIVEACRVLAARELADGVLGHVSVRVDDTRMWLRCRGPRERGLAFSEEADVRLVDLDGRGDPGEGYRLPAELALHAAVLRARPDVDCVVHAHPFAVLAADLAGWPVIPLLGAYDMPGAALAAGGVPVYGRSVLVRTPDLGREVADALGERPAVIMRGHGLTAVGRSPAEAVLRARSVDVLSRMSLAVAAAGGTPEPIAPEDLDGLPDLGDEFTLTTSWRHELARLDP